MQAMAGKDQHLETGRRLPTLNEQHNGLPTYRDPGTPTDTGRFRDEVVYLGAE